MATEKLRNALKNYLISFDQLVLMTDLMVEYEVPFKEVQLAVQEYIAGQEHSLGTKFEKRFLVRGKEIERANEIFTVVPESKLNEWLNKLKNAESNLYAVQVLGGAKSAAQELKPLGYYSIGFENARKTSSDKQTGKKDESSKLSTTKRPAPTESPQLAKKELQEEKNLMVEKKELHGENNVLKKKKGSPEKKKTPTNKKGINNFFAPKTDEAEAKSKPKELQDFFKKSPITTKSPGTATVLISSQQQTSPLVKKLKPATNVSMDLFDEADKKISKDSSSDEEEMLQALKRQVGSDHEKHGQIANNIKRRRIVDSEDEDQPQSKQDKVEEQNEKPNSEVYMDDDGFVITVKPKKSVVPQPKKDSPPSPAPKPVPTKRKISPKNVPPSKTKQGNITNFFKKK